MRFIPFGLFAAAGLMIGSGSALGAGGLDHIARLWDAASGEVIREFIGHTNEIRSVAFAPDGKQVLTGSADGTARLWDILDNKELLKIEANSISVESVAFSFNGKQILTGGEDGTTRLWDAMSGRELRKLAGGSCIKSVAFSPNDKQILTGGEDKTARLWDAANGNEIRIFEGHEGQIESVAFSPNGKQVATGGDDKTARLWDAASGREITKLEAHSSSVESVAFSPDGKQVLTGGQDGTVRLWDAATGKELRKLKADGGAVASAVFSPDGKQVLTGGEDRTTQLWDANSGNEIRGFDARSDVVYSVAFSRHGNQVLTGSSDETARLWDAASGKEIRRFVGEGGKIMSTSFSSDDSQVATGSWDRAWLWDVATGKLTGTFGERAPWLVLSPDGKQALSGSNDKMARLWDLASGNEIRKFEGHTEELRSVAFSPDGKQVLTGSDDKTARLWDKANGKEIHKFEGHVGGVRSVTFSPDGKQVLTGSFDGTARLWDAVDGREIRKFEGHRGLVDSVVFSPDGKRLLTGNSEGTTCLWDTATGEELCAFVSFANGDWAVVDPRGRFDASNAGSVKGLHWVIGNEPIDLAQLKERYYEPGLLAKKMGFNRESLRDVESFTSPKLFPTVALLPPRPNNPTLGISLANRGEGIGRVVVRINGKELFADARGRGFDPNAAGLQLYVPLPPNQPLLIPGRQNKIEVEAYNAEGYLRSRGLEFDYEPAAVAPAETPQIWIVVAGVSSYRGESLHLQFAAKDAEDFAKAVEIGAKRLFGSDRVHLTLLTSSQADTKQRPTRANLLATFQAIRDGKAKSTDILVVYLAGHGATYGGQDGDFYFLTSDAQSADLSDPAVRQNVALSGQEIAEQINSVPALKQVLLLDTCASGRLIEKLTEKRDVPTSQVRALDRLKDRTGMFVLAGCAADSVSYEASRYGQGVLTYSLLLGLRGSALREEQFVDVDKLFGFAADRVPELAHDIGGIQRPVIAVPKGGASFDIGQLSAADRERIPLQPARPVVLRSTFEDEDSFDDVLGLRKQVDELLRNSVVRGSKAGMVFVDAPEMPDAYRLVGRYKTSDGKTTVRAKLFSERQKPIEFTVTGTAAKPDELAQRIVAEVEKRVVGKEGGP